MWWLCKMFSAEAGCRGSQQAAQGRPRCSPWILVGPYDSNVTKKWALFHNTLHRGIKHCIFLIQNNNYTQIIPLCRVLRRYSKKCIWPATDLFVMCLAYRFMHSSVSDKPIFADIIFTLKCVLRFSDKLSHQ